MKNPLLCLTGLAATAALSSSAFAQSRLIGIDTSTTGNNAVEIDPMTGATTVLGPVTGLTGAIGALTYDPTSHTIYLASTSLDELYTFDANTLDATLVGPFNVDPSVVMHGLEWVPTTSTLYGRSSGTANGARFFSIDAQSGQATPIPNAAMNAINNAGSIAWANGTLYLADTLTGNLYTVDLLTGAPTLVGPIGGSFIGAGLAYSPTYGMIAVDNIGDNLYSLDLATGASTLIGPVGAANVISLVFIDDGYGTLFCDPAPVNSTGASAVLQGTFQAGIGSGLHLEMTGGPTGELGYFLVGTGADPTPSIPLGNGLLCLATASPNVLGRYNVVGGALNSIGLFDAGGTLQNLVGTSTVGSGFDVPTLLPLPGSPSILAGSTYHFQGWFRDTPAGVGQSNASNGLTVSF
ncbi:MAG: hypothetical protein R3F33_06890 [Planctomycetota bacterium]